MTEQQHTRADWRPPTDQDWRRLRTLLSDVRIFLEMNAEDWEQAEKDVRTVGGEHWPIAASSRSTGASTTGTASARRTFA